MTECEWECVWVCVCFCFFVLIIYCILNYFLLFVIFGSFSLMFKADTVCKNVFFFSFLLFYLLCSLPRILKGPIICCILYYFVLITRSDSDHSFVHFCCSIFAAVLWVHKFFHIFHGCVHKDTINHQTELIESITC